MDVNALVAWGWVDHLNPDRTVRWIAERRRSRGARPYTSPLSEMGFVRVSVQRAAGLMTLRHAVEILRGIAELRHNSS